MLKDGKPSHTSMREKYDAIIKGKIPETMKYCRRYYGTANFLSSIFKDFQKHLIPSYELHKEKKFEGCQKALKNIKLLLITPLILCILTANS